MGRHLPTGMYRNAFKHERSAEYERHYRLATMEQMRWLKPRQRPYQPTTSWFRMMYPKALPSRYRPRMARDNDDNWHLPYEQMRLKKRTLSQRQGQPR